MHDKIGQDLAAYSRRQWALAVNLSAVLGWLFCVGWVFLFSTVTSGGLSNFIWALSWAAVIGLPIAFAMSWLIVAPILIRVMRASINWSRAAMWGAINAFCIALVGIGIGRLHGLYVWMSPSMFAQVGGGDKVRSIDGMLTSYGWLVVAEDAVMLVGGGVLVALLIRALIGPGQNAE